MSFCAAYLGIHAQRERDRLIFSDDQVWQTWFKSTRDAINLSFFAIVPIIFNAVLVQNCNWFDGFLFFLLLPIASCMVASAWGIALARMHRGMISFTLLFILSILYGVWLFVSTPVVDIFSPFMGYYPGAIYDEEIYIGQRLLYSRLEDLSYPFIILAIQSFLQNPWLTRYRVILTSIIISSIFIHVKSDQSDIHRDEAHIQTRLGGHKSSTHFMMYYPQEWSATKSDLLLKELEFVYQELYTFFALNVSQKINVYFYKNAYHKKRLMGAGRTLIAKPWQYAVHVHRPSIGYRVIMHELAHVFSAEISNPPHHLSLYKDWIPHMSLIEGLAVAATWSKGRLTPHQWSAAMQKLEMLPPMQELLSPQGFYSRNSRLAYTLCGSFVRFYREKNGQEALADFYRSGQIQGGTIVLEQVVNQWQSYIQSIPLHDNALAFAKTRFDHPSIFQKVCAHEIANLRESAMHHEYRQDWQKSLQVWDQILHFKGHDRQAHLNKINAFYQLGDYQKGLEWSAMLMDNSTLDSWTRQKAREWHLDLSVLHNQNHKVTYDDLIEHAFNEHDIRRLWIKKEALTQGDIGKRLLKFMRQKESLTQKMLKLEALIKEEKKWSVLYYLYARYLFNQEQFDFAKSAFQKASTLGLKHSSLQKESELSLAHIDFKKGLYQEAAHRFEALTNRQDLDLQVGDLHKIQRWHRRSLFFARTQ